SHRNPSAPARQRAARVNASPTPTWFRLALVCVPLAALCAYANTFGNGFTIYDFPLFLDNPRIRDLSNVPSFFVDSRWGGTTDWGFYRPLATVTHALDFFFF